MMLRSASRARTMPRAATVAVVAHTTQNGTGQTTSAIDTTGASLIVVGASTWSGQGAISVSDNKGNTWNPLPLQGFGQSIAQLFYAWNPAVGSNHTFTGTNSLGMIVAAFSGIETSGDPLDQQNGAGGATFQPGSITPSQDNALVITYVGANDNQGGAEPAPTVSSPFAIADSLPADANTYYQGLAWYQQGTAAAINPTWSQYGCAFIASFIAAAGDGGGGGPSTGAGPSGMQATAVPIIQIPPIRTDLQEPQKQNPSSTGTNGTGSGNAPRRTAKEWYYFWQQSSKQINADTQKLANLVTYGAHETRPDPTTMPDGAIYVEEDRNGVVYQSQLYNGVQSWHYCAGTMWGTMTPDQRPTDLGVNDSGFQFRSTDQPPQFWIWSGTGWVQVTTDEVNYGTHENRPAPTSSPDGALYVEQDRNGVIYQNQLYNGVQGWHYLAGTMWGTMVPDQRPTDLGVNDSGFQFRSTDTPPQFWLWSGTQWVRDDQVTYGTHANRPSPTAAADGSIYVEQDRNGVIYQNQILSGVEGWHYLAGTFWGTMVPDQRPTDLGVNDSGFQFRSTDQPLEFIWSGSTWVEVTQAQAGDVQIAKSSGNLTLTTAYTAIPGATLTLNRAGRYLIIGNYTFAHVNDPGQGLRGDLVAGGAQQGGGTLSTSLNNSEYVSAAQQWIYQAASAGVPVYLVAVKDGGSGTSSTAAPFCSITAIWISP